MRTLTLNSEVTLTPAIETLVAEINSELTKHWEAYDKSASQEVKDEMAENQIEGLSYFLLSHDKLCTGFNRKTNDFFDPCGLNYQELYATSKVMGELVMELTRLLCNK